MSTTLMQASHQWSTRPSDERFVSLTDLDAHCQNIKANSKAITLETKSLQAVPVEGDFNALLVSGPNGVPVAPTHWSFGQLCQRVGAPAGYLRDLPAPLAADNINYGIFASVGDIGVLLYKNGGPAQIKAITGPDYGRIWNASITRALVQRFGDGLTGAFKVPGGFGKRVAITKDNTTLYASDRDMFVFLADEEHRIEIPNRRDGKSGQLARGFFVWNSEVGKCKFGIATFLFDYVCCNRIVWGAQGYEEITIRHTTRAPERWVDQALPALQDYANSSTAGVKTAIEAAMQQKIGHAESREDDVAKFLASRFSRSQVSAIKAAHMADEQRPIETLWDAATAVTAYARSIPYQDERVEIEREGGKILKLAA
jgi:Domain of unknown function (DUF932)